MTLSGQVLLNRYELMDVVGTGGMAVVYSALDHINGNEVAVKILRDEYSTDEDFIRRFNREARAAAAMAHPNIVRVFDTGDENGLRFIVMEYVRGVTLKDIIKEQGSLSIDTVVDIGVQICHALSHAHAAHIVHRDIKPQNILIDGDGTLKVADFGIARVTNTKTETLTDSVMGSVHYISPEQARGGLADEKSDLYSLGVVLYEALVGQVPFDGDSAVTVALRHIQEPPRRPRRFSTKISVAMEEIILKAMQKDKEQRYQSAEEFEADLLRALKQPDGGFVKLKRPLSDGPTREVPVTDIAGKRAESAAPKQKPTMARRMLRTFIALAVVCAVVIVLALSVNAIISLVVNGEMVEVPDVTSLSKDDAREMLDENGFNVVYDNIYDDTVAYGHVIATEPEGATFKRRGASVLVKISLGPHTVEMPDLTGNTEEEAREALKGLYLELANVREGDSKLPRGTVFKQEPAAGAVVNGGSSVDIWLSQPPFMRDVPNVTSHSLEEARELVESAGLDVGEIIEDIDITTNLAPGYVFKQSPESGSVSDGTRIDLWVVKEPTPLFRKETTVSFSVPKGGADVRIVYEDGEESSEVQSEWYAEGDQTFTISLSSKTSGRKHLIVYFNGERQFRKSVDLTELETPEPAASPAASKTTEAPE